MSFTTNCKEVNTKIQKDLQAESIIQSFSINSNGVGIKQVLSINALPRVENTSVGNGFCEISGTTNAKVLILNNESEYLVLEENIPFSTKIQDFEIVEGASVLASSKLAELKNVVANENSITFNTYLVLDAYLIKNQTFRYVESAESLCQKSAEFSYDDIVSNVSQNFEVMNEVNLPNSISKIISVYGSCNLENCSCGNDVLMLDGKVFANVLFLTNEDEPKLKSQEYVLDFSHEILCTGINQENISYCKTVLNGIDYEVQGEMNSSKGVLTIKTQLSALGVIKKSVVINGISDAFCPTHNIVCENANILTQNNNNLSLREKIDGSLSIVDDVQIDKVMCISNSYVTFNSTKNQNGLEIVGVLHANVIYKLDDEKGTIGAVVGELPFVKQIDDCNCDFVNIHISIANIEARSKRAKDIDVQAELMILINFAQNETKTIVSNITLGDELFQNYKPMGVYFVSQAEQLWDVAKQLKVNPETISMQNPNLNFPITEPTKILVYRQYLS